MLKFVSMMLAVASLLAAGDGEGEGKRGCSVATLKGTYGSLITGIKPSGPPPAPLEQTIGVVIQHFDGLGHLTRTDNVLGSISGPGVNLPGTGTYSINEDCSGTMNLSIQGAPPLEVRFVVVDKGREFRAIVMSPPTVMVTAVGKKI
jgi:hypothetical protein